MPIIGRQKIIVVGHKANSIRKLFKYLSIGVPAVEIDILKSLENGRLMIQHISDEEEMLKEVHPETPIFELEEFLRRFKSGIFISNYHSPLEVLRELSGVIDVVLDLKNKSMSKDVVEMLSKIDFRGTIYLTSKFHRDLYEIKKRMPKVKILVTLENQPVNTAEYLGEINANGVSIKYPFIDKGFVDELHRLGYIVDAWVVNDIYVAKYLAKLRVDMITTDNPSKILKALKGNTHFSH